jgi:hypothetical protein
MTRWARWPLVIAATALLPLAGEGTPLEPLTPGWQQIFQIHWDAGTWRGKPAVQGYLVNDSPYTLGRIQLLVESLDGAGGVVAQRVDWVQGAMTPFSRTYFSAPAPDPATSYRVRVFSYDRFEAGGTEFN